MSSHGTKDQRARSSVGTFAAIVGASIGSGILGYILAQNQQAHKLKARDARADAVPDSPTFGSPLDFQKAILELKATFVDASAVSTDPDDLHTHGFSKNDYYSGAFLLIFLNLIKAQLKHINQVYHTVS